MRLNKKLLGRSLYKITTILFLIGYNFAPSAFAIGDISKLENKESQSVSATIEDTSEDIHKEGVSDPEWVAKGNITSSVRGSTAQSTRGSGLNVSASSSGVWTEVDNQNILVSGTLNTNWIKWDKTVTKHSGLQFIGKNGFIVDGEDEFELATLNHYNYPVNDAIENAKLKVTITLGAPINQTKDFNMDLTIDETLNKTPCPSWHTPGHPACDDKITFPTVYSKEFFVVGDTKYVLEITGFIQGSHNVGQFITEEKKTNEAIIRGRLRSIPAKVTICHASDSHSNPYITHTPSANGHVDGHNGHNGPIWYPGITENWGDIIPEFRYFDSNGNVKVYPGKNNTEYGLSILENGCKFPEGKITVTKEVEPVGDSTEFPIVGSGTPAVADSPATFKDSNTGTISRTKSATFNVYPGTYSFIETVPTGWIEVSNNCNNIQVANGDEKSCIIKNAKASSITIIKHAEQVSDTSFGFTATGTGLFNFSLVDNSTSTDPEKVFTNLLPGNYSITENSKEGWYLKSATCNNGQSPDALTLTAGSNVICTFTNTKYGSLTIVKDAKPSSTQEFSFTTTGTGLSNFTLVDNSDTGNPSKKFENLLAGIYSVAETVPSDWYLDSTICSDSSPITAIDLSAGEDITCTFKNIKYGSISGHKYHDLDGSASTPGDQYAVSGYTIFIDTNNNGKLDAGEPSTTTGTDGSYSFTNLKPGTYKIAEVMKIGWIVLPTTSTSQSVTLSAGENRKDVNFINVEKPTIQVIKNVDTDGDGTVDVTNVKDWKWKIGSDEYDTGREPVPVMPGNYDISELQKPDYHVTSLVCTNGETTIVNTTSEYVNIILKSGDKVLCTFTNTRNTGTLIVKKVVVNDNGGNLEAKDFSFKIGDADAVSFTPVEGNVLLGENKFTKYAGLSYNIVEVEANERGYTTSYDNCSNVTVPHNGTATCTITNNDNKPSLKLVKEVVNDNGGDKVATDWTLTATGPVTVTGDGVATSGDDFEAGTYTLSEAGKTGVDVSGYKAGNWSCTNDITVNENNQITVPLGKSTVCTIVNDDIAPSLELVKVVKNDFGGNAVKTDWNLKAEGVSSINGDGGVKSGTDFKAGAYTLSEAGVEGSDVSGYSAGDWSCTNGITVDNNEINIGIGESTVCTITNTEIQPTLKLVKTVDNSNGGTKEVSDFKLYIGDNQVTSGVANGVNSRVEYTVREDQLDGYTASVWGGDCSSDGKITLKSGDNKTCTITNTAIAPTLKLVKNVINDNGGTLTPADWTLTATGDSGFSDTGNSTTFHTVKAGVGYVLSESEKSGYLPEDWSCDGGTLSSNTITLGLAENVTCTITNNDVAPKLTLNKIVSNTHGGNNVESDWTLKATSGTEVLSGSGASGDADVVSGATFKAGTYTLSEEGPSGYDASAWTCTGTGTQSGSTITLGIGQEAVCSITNSDRASGLTVKKHVKNDNGGTAKADDFGIKLNNNSISFGAGQDAGEEVTTYTSTPSVSSNVEYTLSEIDHSGYDEGTWSCTDNSDGSSVSMPFTLAEGQSVTCEITNDDIAPKLTLNKIVSNTHGGNNVESDWTLTATSGTEVLSGLGAAGDADVVSGSTFKAGTYTLSEEGPSGYDASAWTCTGTGTQSGNSITLGVGEEAVCSITNSDKSQDITIIKKVINDNGGNATVDDFNITLTDTTLTFGTGVVDGTTTTYTTTVSGKSNKEYTLSEVVAGTGYTKDSLSCTVGTDGIFTLTEGQNVTCTIVNNDIAPGLTIKKHVKNDNGGTATVGDFGITLTDTDLTFDEGVTNGTTTTYTSNPTVVSNKTYTVTEGDHAGYDEGTWSCTDNSDGSSVSIPFTLSEGQSVTCEVTNDDIQPKLKVVKVVKNGTYGNKNVSDFNLYVSGTSVTSGDTNGFNAGNYTVSEDNLAGYTAVITGDCASDGKVTLTAGDNKTCKITNTSTHGKIIIKKVVEPNTDSTTFKFTGDVEGTIGHNGEISKIVIPGTYSVSETVPEGWNLRDLTCEDPTQDSAQDSTDKNKVNINVSNNETVTCTFTNEKLGKISGYKYEDKNGNGNWDDGEIALSGWTINNGLGGTTTTNASGYYEFTNLPVGDTYTVREVNLLGWKQTSTNPSAITIVAGMDKQNVNFGNFKNVTINVTKDVVGIDGVTDVADSTEFESLLNDADAKTIAERTTATYTVEDPGEYSVTESVNTDYDYIGCFLGDNEFSNYSVESGQTYNVVCKNKQKPATLIVNKSVIDSENNDEGVFSEDEFDVVLGEETKQIADKEGGKVKAEFGGLQPGDYTFTETPKDGYIFDGCTNDGKVTLGSNKTVEVTCTNRIIDPILKIEKSNNKTGIDQYAGKDEVTYTIKVTAPKDESEGTYVLNNVVVSDIAPAGFKYISGTWTAKKNGTDIVIPEPTYNGTEKAQWLLGSMKEGDEIVVTYRTKISNTQDAGLYPDIAWVVGDSLSGGSVLGASTSDPATPFVGTEVKVIEDDIVEKGEVLGASISLPNTGANTYLTLGALIMMIIGAISLLFKPFKKFKYALLSALIAISFVTLITPNTVLAADSDIQVKIMKPETPTNKKSFNVGFVVLDLSNNPVTVECFKDAEVEPFETHTPANAGNCAVTIAASGTYTFYVKATSASGTKKTAPVTVEVNLDKPSPVIDYSKAGNVLKFKTANDGKTVKVEIHRSEKSSYTANASTKIHEMVVAPNTEYTWTDATAEPGKTYYYALRSLDAFGNVSTMVSDPVVKVSEEVTATTPRTSGTAVAGTETKTEGEVKGDTDEGTIMDTEEVKEGKEKVQPEKEGEEKEEELTPNYKKYWYIWVPAILLVLGVVYIYVKRSKEE